jgi:hypothetical protein
MTREEAEALAARLQAEDSDRANYRFVARRSSPESWEVARVALPEALRREPLTPTISSAPRPSPADDPRTGHERRVPGFPGGA